MFGLGNVTIHEKRIKKLEDSLSNIIDKFYSLQSENLHLRRKLDSKKRRKNRKQLSHKTGFTKVGQVESLDIYEMYKDGMNVHTIAKTLDRSQSCISRHIRKHMEE